MRLIDADALIEKAYSETEGMGGFYKDFGTIVEWLVDKMPTIEPEQEKDKYNIPSSYPPYSIILEDGKPKKGTWMMNTGLGTLCSNCYYKLETTGLPSYCPHCGADMRGEE